MKKFICPEWLVCPEVNCCHRRPHIEKIYCVLTIPTHYCWECASGIWGRSRERPKPNCLELKKGGEIDDQERCEKADEGGYR